MIPKEYGWNFARQRSDEGTSGGTPAENAAGEHELLDRVEAYLEGVKDDFRDVAIGLTVPTDHRHVLERVREIPYGEQISVADLVRSVPTLDADDDADLDVARTALDENPFPLFVPDHRVRDGPSAAPAEVEQRLRSREGL